MARFVRCDRCGVEVKPHGAMVRDPGVNYVRIDWSSSFARTRFADAFPAQSDLCDRCVESLDDWLKTKPVRTPWKPDNE